MDRLLLISTVFFISLASLAETKEEIQIELGQSQMSQADLYRKLRASMGEPIVDQAPRGRRQLSLKPAPAEYKINLIKEKDRLAKSQKR